ncbi:MAG: MlaD family protein [Alistipes sp.]|jgi:phospholipid/cholesterol/gamma-HCH transport system substrate-binding protein|nr:MlaD family protein [Alistipes sp.]
MKLTLGREVKTGLFAVVMLVCLYLGVNYLKGKEIFSGDRFYSALFDQTNGLQTAAPVLLRGVKVGSVTDIYLDGDHPDKVVVKVGIKKNVDIPSDSHLVLFANGLMGDKAIELVLGSSGSYFERGTTIPAQIASGLFESASTNLEDLVAEAKSVMQSLEATSTSLGNLLDRNADALAGIVDNMESVTGQLSGAGIDAMIGDLESFTAMLRDNTDRFESIAGNLDRMSGSLAGADLRGTVDSLGATIANLNRVLAAVSDGDGTAARLIGDPALYDSLTVATGNLATLLKDLQSNPKRYVHFSLFGRKNR